MGIVIDLISRFQTALLVHRTVTNTSPSYLTFVTSKDMPSYVATFKKRKTKKQKKQKNSVKILHFVSLSIFTSIASE